MSIICIIVPVFNVEKYLHRCIDSILNHTFKDFTLVIVDDGSPDNCPKICDDYNLKDNRVVVIRKKWRFIICSKCRIRLCVNNSLANYITFIYSDDYVSPDYLEILYSALQNNNTTISMCLVKRTDLSDLEEFMPTKNYDVEIFSSHSFLQGTVD